MTDTFLNIQGMKGESTDAAHRDWSEVSSFEWGVRQAASAMGVGAAQQRADFEDFVVCKGIDRASAPLCVACSGGRHITKVVLEACRAGGGGEGQKLFFRVTLKDVVVSSVRLAHQSIGGSTNDPVERVAFRYSEIASEYFEMSHEGRMAKSPFNYGWNLKTNKST